eukprot:34922_1
MPKALTMPKHIKNKDVTTLSQKVELVQKKTCNVHEPDTRRHIAYLSQHNRRWCGFLMGAGLGAYDGEMDDAAAAVGGFVSSGAYSIRNCTSHRFSPRLPLICD